MVAEFFIISFWEIQAPTQRAITLPVAFFPYSLFHVAEQKSLGKQPCTFTPEEITFGAKPIF